MHAAQIDLPIVARHHTQQAGLSPRRHTDSATHRVPDKPETGCCSGGLPFSAGPGTTPGGQRPQPAYKPAGCFGRWSGPGRALKPTGFASGAQGIGMAHQDRCQGPGCSAVHGRPCYGSPPDVAPEATAGATATSGKRAHRALNSPKPRASVLVLIAARQPSRPCQADTPMVAAALRLRCWLWLCSAFAVWTSGPACWHCSAHPDGSGEPARPHLAQRANRSAAAC